MTGGTGKIVDCIEALILTFIHWIYFARNHPLVAHLYTKDAAMRDILFEYT